LGSFSDSSSDGNGLFEFDMIKMNIDGNRQDCYVIQIGRKSIDLHHPSQLKILRQTDHKGQLMTTPPRLSKLCLQQQKSTRYQANKSAHTDRIGHGPGGGQ
jgi:hypothetical protein